VAPPLLDDDPTPSPPSSTSTIAPLIPEAIASRTRSVNDSDRPGIRASASRPRVSGTRRFTTWRPDSLTSIRIVCAGEPSEDAFDPPVDADPPWEAC